MNISVRRHQQNLQLWIKFSIVSDKRPRKSSNNAVQTAHTASKQIVYSDYVTSVSKRKYHFIRATISTPKTGLFCIFSGGEW